MNQRVLSFNSTITVAIKAKNMYKNIYPIPFRNFMKNHFVRKRKLTN